MRELFTSESIEQFRAGHDAHSMVRDDERKCAKFGECYLCKSEPMLPISRGLDVKVRARTHESSLKSLAQFVVVLHDQDTTS